MRGLRSSAVQVCSFKSAAGSKELWQFGRCLGWKYAWSDLYPYRIFLHSTHLLIACCVFYCRYASSNTRRGVESCGILAGILDERNGCFQICTLIIPKQEGTSDTVQVRSQTGMTHARLW